MKFRAPVEEGNESVGGRVCVSGFVSLSVGNLLERIKCNER